MVTELWQYNFFMISTPTEQCDIYTRIKDHTVNQNGLGFFFNLNRGGWLLIMCVWWQISLEKKHNTVTSPINWTNADAGTRWEKYFVHVTRSWFQQDVHWEKNEQNAKHLNSFCAYRSLYHLFDLKLSRLIDTLFDTSKISHPGELRVVNIPLQDHLLFAQLTLALSCGRERNPPIMM